MKFPLLPPLAATLATILLVLALPLTGHGAELRRTYLVRLTEQPVAAYAGGITGLGASRALPGQRLDPSSAPARAYASYLAGKQASVRALVPAAPVRYSYRTVLNGFSARLTAAEVRKLKSSAAVASIVPDDVRHLVTSYTPTFLGLDASDGLWQQLGGPQHAGDDIVIGLLDGGIWPENPAFADRVDNAGQPTFDGGGTLAYGPAPAGWHGSCQSGEGFQTSDCNNKLIGARYYNDGFLAEGLEQHWSDFVSPRDSVGGTVGEGGHGTHTSSTAAGNHGVPADIGGAALGRVSGMAPRARVAMYKVCWSYNDIFSASGASNGCWLTDIVAAIEQATADGVQVLNYSISGGSTLDDPVELAFLQASNAGVFVAVAAGNDGPYNTVAHNSPWLTTVAATTHDRVIAATLTLASGAAYQGASLNASALPQLPLLRAEDAGLAGADPALLRLCYSSASNGGAAVLDPAKVAGKIIVCVRGDNARLDKSVAVRDAGGAGMVLVDNGAGLVTEVHAVPTIHVTANDGALIDSYAVQSGAAAVLSAFHISTGGVPAPLVADFSSRGPNTFDLNVLKPDLAGPGVDVLAGVTPELTVAQRAAVVAGTLRPPVAWNLYAGTSMATPHVAGVAALLRQAHPGWSPAAVKSALMTSAKSTLDDGLPAPRTGTLPWSQGAGQIVPTVAAATALVYDAGPLDYQRYLCGAGWPEQCGSGTLSGTALNLASITVANAHSQVTVQRTVTNGGTTTASYQASATLSGYDVTVAPGTLTLAPGAQQRFAVTLTRTTAPDDTWQFGELVWSDGSHHVRSPLQARSGALLVAPALVQSERASGALIYNVGTDFAGPLLATQAGLKAATRTTTSVADAPEVILGPELVTAACNANASGSGVTLLPYTLPANLALARFTTYDADVASSDYNDIDLAVLKDGVLQGYSGAGGSNEAIALLAPAAGSYDVCLIGYHIAGGNVGLMLSSVLLQRDDSGAALRVLAPAKVYASGSATVGVSWAGLAAGQRYAGLVNLLKPDGAPGASTVVSVDTTDPLPAALSLTKAAPRRSIK